MRQRTRKRILRGTTVRTTIRGRLAKLAAVLEHYIFSLVGIPCAAFDFKINRSGEGHCYCGYTWW